MVNHQIQGMNPKSPNQSSKLIFFFYESSQTTRNQSSKKLILCSILVISFETCHLSVSFAFETAV
jgi:hypothetical protein